MSKIIYELKNEEYHRGEDFCDYLSSSQIKDYIKSPLYAHLRMTDPAYKTEQTEAMRKGTLFHDAMEFIANGGVLFDYLSTLAHFDPPINDKTGLPYGPATKAYQAAYASWLNQDDVVGKVTVSDADVDYIASVVNSAMANKNVQMFINQGKPDFANNKGPEISFFYEGTTPGGNPLKMKCRPDLLTLKKCIDYKTTSIDYFTNETLGKAISDFNYHVSGCFYQYVLWKTTGKFYSFYWVFVSTADPHEVAIVGSSHLCFTSIEDLEMFDADIDGEMVFNPGVMKFRDLLHTHVKCIDNDCWPGSDSWIEPDDSGLRIFEPEVPAWEAKKSYKSHI